MSNEEELSLSDKERQVLSDFIIVLSKQVRENTVTINTLLQNSQNANNAPAVTEMVNFHERLSVLEQKTDEICSFINHLIMSTSNGAWENETWTKH